VALRTNERNIQIENITKERAKWRNKIRRDANSACAPSAMKEGAEFEKLRMAFSLNLNPLDVEDNGIMECLEKFPNEYSKNEALKEFTIRLSLLLKHDWERAKYEAKSWIYHVFRRAPMRTRYDDFVLKKDFQMKLPPIWHEVFEDQDNKDRGLVILLCVLFLLFEKFGWLPYLGPWVDHFVLFGAIFFSFLVLVKGLWSVVFGGVSSFSLGAASNRTKKGVRIENDDLYLDVFNKIAFGLNIFFLIVLVGFFSTRRIQYSALSAISPVDVIVIVLTALGVILTALAIFLAVLGFVGFTRIRDEARRIAKLATDEHFQKAASKDNPNPIQTPVIENVTTESPAEQDDGDQDS
jgi:hypothetical protein